MVKIEYCKDWFNLDWLHSKDWKI